MEETWRSYNREEHRISNTVPTSRYDLKLELELREIEWNCPELRGIGRKLNALETLQVQDLWKGIYIFLCKNLSFTYKNSGFLILVYLQPNVEHLWYFKQWILLDVII